MAKNVSLLSSSCIELTALVFAISKTCFTSEFGALNTTHDPKSNFFGAKHLIKPGSPSCTWFHFQLNTHSTGYRTAHTVASTRFLIETIIKISFTLFLFRRICVWIKWLAKNATKRRCKFNLQRRDRPQIKADPYEIIVALAKSVSSGTGFLFKIITYKNSLRPNNLAWQSFCLFLRDQQYDKFSNLFHLIHRVKNRTIPDCILVLVF